MDACYGSKDNRGEDPSEWRKLNGYRLPTEAEWEYACRGGTTTYYYWGDVMDDSKCWYGYGSGGPAEATGNHVDVGYGGGHPYGLYDMSGNVYEWCSDWEYMYNAAGTPEFNPTGPGSGLSRIMRGGSFASVYQRAWSGYRAYASPEQGIHFIGFRLARSLY